MANYNRTTNFGVKDNLPSGDPNKIIRGSEFDAEFDAVASAITSKVEPNNPNLSGTTTVEDLIVTGTLSVTGDFVSGIDGGTY